MKSASPARPSSLLTLDSEVLTVVLSMTCAADHPSLSMTCTRLRDILDSFSFRKQCAETGHAEIQVVFATAFGPGESNPSNENDDAKEGDDSCGFQNKKAHILVDGVKAGEVSLTLVARESFCNFHSLPSRNSSFEETFRLLFDSVGEPRHKSMKEALGKAGNRYGLVFINHFTIYDPLHRASSLTGARALRTLLEDRALKERYSIVVHAVPDVIEHNAGKDAGHTKNSDSSHQSNDFAKRDLQHFFRAGFRRIPEPRDSDGLQVFAVREFFDAPLLSEKEAKSIQDQEMTASLMKKKLSEDAHQLLEMIQYYCGTRESMVKDLIFMQRNPGCLPRGKRTADKWALQCALFRYRLMEEEADRQLENLQHNTQSNKSLLDGDMKTYHGLTSIAATLVGGKDGDNLKYVLQQRFNHLDEELDEFRYQLNKLRDRRRNAELNFQFADFPIACQKAKLQEMDERTRYELQRLLDVYGVDVFENSNVLHFCAFNLLPDVIELVMAGVPNDDKKRVINALDHQGQTPLMVAAHIQNNFHRYAIESRVKTIEILLELGAETSIVDALGLTALGHFRKSLQRVQECVSSEESYIRRKNFRQQMEASLSMEVLLWPDGGPSTADRTFLRWEQSNVC